MSKRIALSWVEEPKKLIGNCVTYGEAIIDGDFEEGVSNWRDAMESVPEEDFETLYLRILDSVERSFVQQAWKVAAGMNSYKLDELATMVRIYSNDTYELLPEPNSRTQKHWRHATLRLRLGVLSYQYICQISSDRNSFSPQHTIPLSVTPS